MHKSGAQLVRYALEKLSIQHTFGVLGNQNREIYNELKNSSQIQAHLVNQELSAAFMADAISRTSTTDAIGTMLITADAIVSQGVTDAFVSGVPLLIIAGSGARERDGINSQPLMQPVTKACLKISHYKDLVTSLFEAHQIATSNKPGPVYVEIPVDVQIHIEDIDDPLPVHLSAANQSAPDQEQIDGTAQLLLKAEQPALFIGWGATHQQAKLIDLSEFLSAPVCTSLQGNGAFPAKHPLHTGLSTSPVTTKAFRDCDCLVAIGTNTTDLDYLDAPDQIVHLQPDAIPALLYKLRELKPDANDKGSAKGLAKTIARAKLEQREDWLEHNSKGRVNPEVFFSALSKATSSKAIVVTDQGAHRALTAELLPINNPKGFVSPATLNAMGYCVPAVNAIKLASPDTEVVGIVGDGAMIINGMEALTAVREKLGAVYCLFNNSERTKEKNLGHINWGAFADALECGYFPITSNKGIDTIVRRALETADQGQPVILDIYIDYSRKSHYAQRREKAELASLPSRDKLSIVKRAIVRKIMGSIKQKDSV